MYFPLFIGFETEGRKFLPFLHWFLTILTRFCGIFIKILVVCMHLFLVLTTFYPFFSQFFYDLVNFFVKNGRPIVWLGVISTFYWFWKKGTKILQFLWLFWRVLVMFYGIFIKILVVCMHFFLVSTTFFPFFARFFYDLVNFFVKNVRPIVLLGVFSTFYWFWKKVTKIFTFFAFFLNFLTFFVILVFVKDDFFPFFPSFFQLFP